MTIWSLFWSIFTFGGMKLTNQMTVSEETELKGLDVILHGETAYQILEDDQNQVNNSNRKVMIFLTQF